MRMLRRLVNIGILVSLMCPAVPIQAYQSELPLQIEAEPEPDNLRVIAVDASSNLGQFKSLRGLNSGPLPWSDRPAVEQLGGEVEVSDRTGYRSLGADASAGYRLANIDLIRIHDNYGPGA